MARPIRVVHYVNQFFAGIGGEDRASVKPEARVGVVGPGRALQAALGDQGIVVGTVFCGDNYFNEQMDAALPVVVEHLRSFAPDVLVAGPAFDAGRYGLACGRVCQAAVEDLGVPAVTGLFPENPAVDLYRRWAVIVPTGDSATAMAKTMPELARLALRLGAGEPLGPAGEEGYLPRGVRKNGFTAETAAVRAVRLLLQKVRGEAYRTEVPLPSFDRVQAPPPVADLRKATVAIVTEGGLVPKGNPDRLAQGWATTWAKYSLAGIDDLTGERYESIHGGFDTEWVDQDPDRLVPLDVLREAEQAGLIGRIHDYYYVTAGMATPVGNAAKIGREIAAELKTAGVDVALLTAT